MIGILDFQEFDKKNTAMNVEFTARVSYRKTLKFYFDLI